jgi:ATP-dependent DNA ligase
MTAPMLATLTDRYFSDPGWIFERKLDGERVIGTRSGTTVTLRSRTGRVLDGTYPELVRALRRQRGNFVVDGEVVAFDGNRTGFERLQRRIGLTDPARAEESGVPVYFYLFDLLARVARTSPLPRFASASVGCAPRSASVGRCATGLRVSAPLLRAGVKARAGRAEVWAVS